MTTKVYALVPLFEKFIKSNIIVFRAVDPGLTHVFHKIECDSNLSEEKMIMCLGSKRHQSRLNKFYRTCVLERKLI